MTISIANFKGGVGKTTTAITLAQGMSLLGHKVLVIDTDPQGSLTTLFGILPDAEVEEEDTILPLVMGAETSIRYAIRCRAQADLNSMTAPERRGWTASRGAKPGRRQ